MSGSGSFSKLLSTPAFKFIVLGILTLVLMIPLLLVYLVVDERERYSRQAISEVGRKWGRQQAFAGPYLIVPLRRETERVDRQGNKTRFTETRFGIFLPETLDVGAKVEAQELSRGIYKVPVYKSNVTYKGKFIAADLARFQRENFEPRLEAAVLAVQISDVRAIKKTTDVQIGETKKRFQAGVGLDTQRASGIHVKVSQQALTSGFDFEFELPVNGTNYLQFEPSGSETHVSMTSDWPHPSFMGNFLPSDREISSLGFKAKWHVPQLARGQGQVHIRKDLSKLMQHNLFGVKLYQPVGFYDLVSRALKYAVAFIATVFLLVFIMEVYVGRPVHWIQYVFVGFALLIFYLVLLGLAEHFGFEIAYGLASIATSLLIGLYTSSALKSPKKGLFLGGILLAIYGLLYLLLRVEDYALLIGSLSGFFMLAGLMYMTRNVDWSGYSSQKED